MLPRVEINFAIKNNSRNPYACVTHVGAHGPRGWKLDVPAVIRRIESGQWIFFIKRNGRAIDVVVACHQGEKYLKAACDLDQPLGLLRLPGGGEIIRLPAESTLWRNIPPSAKILAFPATKTRVKANGGA